MVVRRWIKAFSLLVFLLLTVQAGLFAQTSSGRSSLFGAEEMAQQKPSEVLGLGELDIPLRVPEEAVFALDEPIDPEVYVLGPGDVIGVNLRSGSGWFFQSMISPDGTLLVPRLPLIRLGGLTLAAAKDTARVLWGGGEGSQVDITLVQLRPMRVSVGGAVNLPGEYIVTGADRATTLMQLAGGLIVKEASLRRAWLTRQDGSTRHVDLLRYLRSGSKDANPRMVSGDHLIVETKEQHGPTIQVGGGVRVAGTYEYVQGDHLADLIEVAGGTSSFAVTDSVELVRFDQDGPAETTFYNLSEIREAGQRGPELFPGDLVNVPEVMSRPRSASITLRGEVKRPGVYPIIAGETRLSDLVARAGGLTDYAYLPAGRIFREMSTSDFRVTEAARIDTLVGADRDAMDVEFLKYYWRTQSRDYFPVEMERIFGDNGSVNSDADVALFDSLIVDIPRKPEMVLVSGQVEKPGYYPFIEGGDYGDYISVAGGYAKGAHKSRARLVGYESPLWQHPSGGTPVEAGSMIFVPAKPVGTDWELFRDVVGIILQFATLYVLVVRTL